jgi:ribosomal-protein-alanine acetyltransferase
VSRRVFLERAGTGDVPALASLAAACFTHPWTSGQIAAEVAGAAPGAVLVLRGLGREGQVELCAACAYRVVLDEMEILELAVHPAWRRRGLARALLEIAFRRAAAAGVRTALLEVRAGNLEALRLYESLGFTREGLRRQYYREPVEDALLLRRAGVDRYLGERVPGSGDRNSGDQVC